MLSTSVSLPFDMCRHEHACAAVQFYLGTTRLQLEHKGDSAHVVTNIANVVPAFGFIGIPVISWLLDSKGYGVTLAVINLLGVLASIFQAMPSLYFQVPPFQSSQGSGMAFLRLSVAGALKRCSLGSCPCSASSKCGAAPSCPL